MNIYSYNRAFNKYIAYLLICMVIPATFIFYRPSKDWFPILIMSSFGSIFAALLIYFIAYLRFARITLYEDFILIRMFIISKKIYYKDIFDLQIRSAHFGYPAFMKIKINSGNFFVLYYSELDNHDDLIIRLHKKLIPDNVNKFNYPPLTMGNIYRLPSIFFGLSLYLLVYFSNYVGDKMILAIAVFTYVNCNLWYRLYTRNKIAKEIITISSDTIESLRKGKHVVIKWSEKPEIIQKTKPSGEVTSVKIRTDEKVITFNNDIRFFDTLVEIVTRNA